jgi:Flp pilus assembly pilin Flp
MLDLLKKLGRDEDGQGMTEYILIVLLIAIAGIVVWKAFGDRIVEMVRGATKELEKVPTTPQGK